MKKLPWLARTFGAVLLGLFSGCLSLAASRKVIWNFNDTLTNTLGGWYNVFGRSPSWARTYLDPDAHLPNTRHSLRVTAHRAADGFCGVWFDFYPAAASPRRYFDAQGYRYFTFWIKGTKSGWDFSLKLVDEHGERNEDALLTRPLDAYLPHGVSTKWQKVSIPLADFPQIDPGSLSRFVLLFNTPGNYEFYLDDIALESRRNNHPTLPAAEHFARQPLTSYPPNAMWVWKTDELFNHHNGPRRLFAFCGRMKVRTIYLSLDFEQTPSGRPVALEKTRQYEALLKQAHRQGFQVDALAGSPEWAVTRYHDRALDAIDLVAEFNHAAPLNARFDGIHFDVEPYVLIGFADPSLRARLLADYLAMVAKCEAQAQAAGLQLSCDVPWWFFPATQASRQAMSVRFNGTTATVGEHLLDLLPSVTIMDYRNEADGAAGIIAFGEPALTEAARQGRKIFIGLETSAEKPVEVEFVMGIPRGRFSRLVQQAKLYGERSFEGYGLYALSGRRNIFVGLGPPLRGAPQPAEPLETALTDLRTAFGATPGEFSVQPLLAEARAAVAADPEWTHLTAGPLNTFGSPAPWAAFQAVHRTAPMITFHGLGRRIFEQETQSVLEWLGPSHGFAGLAFHYYDSLRELMAEP